MVDPSTVTATTRVAAVIGHPVRHSLSPLLHNAAFDALGLDWVYGAFDVEPGAGEAAVRAVATLGLGGLSVTMPHKDAAAAAVDELSPTAAALGAVNCVVNRDGTLVGENTDGDGFVASLRIDHGIDPAGMRCVVLGAGGAARSVILALATAGATEVVVVNRTDATARVAAQLAGDSGRVADESAVAEADLVVNGTPVGMAGTGVSGRELPVDPSLITARQIVADLVVHPLRTPLLEVAAERGARTVPGLGMLVHQAAIAFEHWTGEHAPLDAMWQSVSWD